jgi:hypothetical protein
METYQIALEIYSKKGIYFCGEKIQHFRQAISLPNDLPCADSSIFPKQHQPTAKNLLSRELAAKI